MNERRMDFEQLRDFARHGDQGAFADVVRRHIDLVYATALRKVEDPGGAEEVSQNVFTTLARKAWQFAPDDSLTAWLFRTTLLESKEWVRGEIRRRRREQTAAELGTTMKTPDEQPALRVLLPLLDEALLSLREKDRTALLLRFHESRSLRDVGAALGVSEDAAQKRVAGAVESLSEFFQRRGYRTVTLAATTAALQYTAATASVSTMRVVLNAALSAAPPALTGLTPLLARLASLTKLQKAIVGMTLIAVPFVWHWNENRLAGQVEARRQLEPKAATAQEERPPTTIAMQIRVEAIAPQPKEIIARPTASSPPEKEYSVRLRGMVGLSDFKMVLLEIQHHSLDRPNVSPFVLHQDLKEHETYDDYSISGAYVRFELLEVDPEKGSIRMRETGLEKIDSGRPNVLKVRARENGEEESCQLKDATAANLPPEAIAAICLADVSFYDFVDFYGELTGCTVLCHPMIKSMMKPPLSLTAPAQTRVEAVGVFQRTLQEKGVEAIPDGDKLVLLVPTNLAETISATVANTGHPKNKGPVASKGSIHFENIDLKDLSTIYGALVKRQPVQENRFLGSQQFSFRNQTPLTTEELIHAFDILLNWQGLKVVNGANKSFKVVRLSDP